MPKPEIVASVRQRMICIHPPVAHDAPSLRFGLQDKQRNLQQGTVQAGGSLLFE